MSKKAVAHFKASKDLMNIFPKTFYKLISLQSTIGLFHIKTTIDSFRYTYTYLTIIQILPEDQVFIFKFTADNV